VVARGAEGSVLAARGLRLHAAAADVKVVSKVGAGDSFVGGMSLALARGGDLGEALRWGTAAASAAVMTPASRLCRHEDVEALLPQCTVTSL
ncbi:MAG: PfkB family carbohydrate kinase, partial [Paracoccaceae bacterium]